MIDAPAKNLPAPLPTVPIPRGPVPQAPTRSRREVELTIDGQNVAVPEGSTILEAARSIGIDTPTLCFLESLTPVNVCRVCVVELQGSRTLVPACSRKAESGMVILTDSERVRLSRKVVLEFLASSVDVSTAPLFREYSERYGAQPQRFGKSRATVAQPVKIDNDLYIRDYSKCILCYKCVEACGVDAQNTFAIAVAGRGFGAHIATEYDVPLPDSACVYCGNCIGVCPTGALTIETRETVAFDHTAAEEPAAADAAAGKTYVPQACFRCGTDEDHSALLPVRARGTSTWVCTTCLPALIHG